MTVVAPVLHERPTRQIDRRLWSNGGSAAFDPSGPTLGAIATPLSHTVRVARPRSSTAVTQIPDEAVGRLSELYSFRGLIEVARFIRNQPSLLSPLLDAPSVISRYFGPNVPLALEVFRDPEAHRHRQLFALIQTSLEGDAALEALRRFDEEWWIDALPRTNYKLAFALEYPD